jgi:transcriptional antiterminator RfaH
MPILNFEPDLYPPPLLNDPKLGVETGRHWWAFYLRSRQEKAFMRRLRGMDIPYYGPQVTKRTRSPSGRERSSFAPLFSGYVFVYGDDEARRAALTTNCVSRCLEVADGAQLTHDLRNLKLLISGGAPVTLEAKLEAGMPVRIRTGPFRDMEGVVLQRRGETRILVAVRFLQQGASVELGDYEVERI